MFLIFHFRSDVDEASEPETRTPWKLGDQPDPTAARAVALEKAPIEETDSVFGDVSNLEASQRIALSAIALPFGLLSAWMFWIVHKFWDRRGPRGWFDIISGIVIDEFIVAVGLFALFMVIGAICAPNWLSRTLTAACRKLIWAIAMIGLVFGSATLFLVFVEPFLKK